MSLTVREAQVTTAVVEIKTIVVGGRQMTKALFQQLLEEEIIDYAGACFVGVPWGRVNWHPDGCAKDAPHQHIVWQKGSELRRAKVRPYDWNRPVVWGEPERYVIAAGRLGEDGRWCPPSWARFRSDRWTFEFEGLRWACDISNAKERFDLLSEMRERGRLTDMANRLKVQRAALDALVAHLSNQLDQLYIAA